MKKFAELEKNEIAFDYLNDKFNKMNLFDYNMKQYNKFANDMKKKADDDYSIINDNVSQTNGIFSVEGMKSAVSSLFNFAGNILKSVISSTNNKNGKFIYKKAIENLNYNIEQINQRERNKSINEVKTYTYEFFNKNEK